jgi:hypothetical protein
MADAKQVKIESKPEARDEALVRKLEQQLEGTAEEEIQEVRPYRASGAKHGSAGK